MLTPVLSLIFLRKKINLTDNFRQSLFPVFIISGQHPIVFARLPIIQDALDRQRESAWTLKERLRCSTFGQAAKPVLDSFNRRFLIS
jgi:hypothetical protein